MMDILQKIRRRFTTATLNIIKFLRYCSSNVFSKSVSAQPSQVVYVELSNPRLERYLYLLLKFFELANYKIKMKFSPRLLLNLRNYSDLIYTLKDFQIVLGQPQNYDLWLTDKPNCKKHPNTLTVDTNYFTAERDTNDYFFPYNMHPDVYNSDFYKQVHALRKHPRSIKVFFGGNTGIGYGNPDIPKLFGKITRNDLVSFLESSIDRKKLFIGSTVDDVQTLLSEKSFEVVSVKKPLFTLEQWIKMLSQSNFYIAAPGFSMPFSHNAVEAMAFGTIPILQYPEMFDPPLRHLENCLKFENEADLLEKINLALNIDQEKLAAMKKSVVNYYDNFLDPPQAVANLFKRLSSINRLLINSEHISIIDLKNEINLRNREN